MILKFKIPEPFDTVFSVTVRVTAEGIFTCTLPPAVVELFKGKLRLETSRRGSEGYFSSDTLEGLRAAVLCRITALCSEKEVKREKIIRYAIETACEYGMDTDGDFLPYPPRDTNWHSGTLRRDSNNRGPFGLRLYAKTLEKITYCYEATGEERVEYKSLYIHQFDEDELRRDPIQWLSNMHTLSDSEGHWDVQAVSVKEMPYSDDAAWFFVGLFKWLFGVNERITPFLEPDGVKTLVAAFKAGRPLLGDK